MKAEQSSNSSLCHAAHHLFFSTVVVVVVGGGEVKCLLKLYLNQICRYSWSEYDKQTPWTESESSSTTPTCLTSTSFRRHDATEQHATLSTRL